MPDIDRLNLLREHEKRVTAQMADLAACLDMITCKVRVHESHVADATTGRLWT